MVGINTFIFTEGGGNEGLGFAIPSGVVRRIYQQLRKQGHVHREEIGATVQTITPTLAAGLGLPQDYGVIVSDVAPGGPAEGAGLKVEDIILTLNGKPVINVPQFDAAFQCAGWIRRPSSWRSCAPRRKISLEVPVVEQQGRHGSPGGLAGPGEGPWSPNWESSACRSTAGFPPWFRTCAWLRE